MDPERFVFLDETGAATNMISRYGWGPRGQAPGRRHTAWPLAHHHLHRAGLRSAGLVAPLVLDGPMTGGAFLA